MSANADLFARRQAAIPRGVGHATPVAISRAQNAELWDLDGRRYVDFAAGIAVLNTGHRHPHVMAAVAAEMEKFTHPCFQVTAYESYVALAERLNALAPIEGPAKSIFFTTGAEATENAVKIARAATGRDGVIAFTGAFHGRTFMAMSMTGKVVPYKKGLGASMPNVWHVPFPATHSGVTTEQALQHLDFLFAADIDPARVAAIIVEPVQGEGGFHPAPADLMRGLRKVADAHGIVLIADEVQTGFGRTGKLFAMEHYDVRPDLVCVAKSLAGGFPLSGVIGRAAIMDAAEPGGLGGTYAGNPLACAAALAVLDVIEAEGLVARANAIGARIKARLAGFEGRNDLLPIAGIRGPGAMIAFDIVRERGSLEPDAAATKRVTLRAAEEGLILLSCGTSFSTIRILVPLTASDAIVEEGLDLLERALAA
ncbi:4-aminobutyrate--2-oxoglutarate transaminase [Aquabacter spiritensis]|uniref:4-aminobutyrate aminotransferase n=1 Tax=Aquabacter spiritensis TaxID=933073 RepID=A0A4R3LY83_9HYPH|nr:4-aminobutyrate--2-oxoglutarate transaminase [Aquabacter spiritensis]TCT05664.1 4-aminobutyrate aminotransferase [Aquabacter spiritensis]